MKARPSLEKRRKELQRQTKKADKAERRKERKATRPEPGAGPPIEELTPGELGWASADADDDQSIRGGTDSDSEGREQGGGSSPAQAGQS